MSSRIRKIANQITNRDVIERQNHLIEKYHRKIKEQDEIIGVQSEAISEFKASVGLLTSEVEKLKQGLARSRRNLGGKTEDERKT